MIARAALAALLTLGCAAAPAPAPKSWGRIFVGSDSNYSNANPQGFGGSKTFSSTYEGMCKWMFGPASWSGTCTGALNPGGYLTTVVNNMAAHGGPAVWAGVLCWDCEGHQFGNGGLQYVGHPAALLCFAPEMGDGTLDAQGCGGLSASSIIVLMSDAIHAAHYRVGLTLRGNMIQAGPIVPSGCAYSATANTTPVFVQTAATFPYALKAYYCAEGGTYTAFVSTNQNGQINGNQQYGLPGGGSNAQLLESLANDVGYAMRSFRADAFYIDTFVDSKGAVLSAAGVSCPLANQFPGVLFFPEQRIGTGTPNTYVCGPTTGMVPYRAPSGSPTNNDPAAGGWSILDVDYLSLPLSSADNSTLLAAAAQDALMANVWDGASNAVLTLVETTYRAAHPAPAIAPRALSLSLAPAHDEWTVAAQAYVLTATPVPSSQAPTPAVYLNGLRMSIVNGDYNIVGNVLTFTGQATASMLAIDVQVDYWVIAN